jgi:hypothetical protein
MISLEFTMLPITNLSSSSMVEEMVCAAQIESLLVAYPSSRSTGGLTYKPWLITWMNLPPKSEHLVVKMEPPPHHIQTASGFLLELQVPPCADLHAMECHGDGLPMASQRKFAFRLRGPGFSIYKTMHNSYMKNQLF